VPKEKIRILIILLLANILAYKIEASHFTCVAFLFVNFLQVKEVLKFYYKFNFGLADGFKLFGKKAGSLHDEAFVIRIKSGAFDGLVL